jgi:predicted O-methyltransferase YrrM
MIKLNNVTLYSVDCATPEMAVEALKKSAEGIEFARIVLFSDKRPFNLDASIEIVYIPSIKNTNDYSKFMMNDLINYIKTDFCLSVHADGFVINPDRWSPGFLNFDYIGAPWKSDEWFIVHTRVGNGGVSLRSKKLLEATKDLTCLGNEDVEICQRYYEELIKREIKFAPLDVAASFSFEHRCDDISEEVQYNTLAFHGRDHSAIHKEQAKKLIFQFYKNELINMSNERLEAFLDNEVGVSESGYFGARYEGNLQVQQNPQEYTRLLDFFRSTNIERYLELGVANGGSFFINSLFLQKTTSLIHCVDCLAYKDAPNVQQTENKILSKVNKLKDLFPQKVIEFYNKTTDNFFETNQQMYDCIFIDADHSFDGVMKDYKNSLNFISPGGYLVFHDISNQGTGVYQCWREVSNIHTVVGEFCHPVNKNCGIGIIRV